MQHLRNEAFRSQDKEGLLLLLLHNNQDNDSNPNHMLLLDLYASQLGFISFVFNVVCLLRKTYIKAIRLHEHHRIDVMLITQQWCQSLGCFSS